MWINCKTRQNQGVKVRKKNFFKISVPENNIGGYQISGIKIFSGSRFGNPAEISKEKWAESQHEKGRKLAPIRHEISTWKHLKNAPVNENIPSKLQGLNSLNEVQGYLWESVSDELSEIRLAFPDIEVKLYGWKQTENFRSILEPHKIKVSGIVLV